MSSAIRVSLACQKETDAGLGAAAGDLTSEDQKTISAIGRALARELESFKLDASELGILARGLTDGVLGRPSLVDLEAQMPKIQEFGMARVNSCRTWAAAYKLAVGTTR